MNDSRDRSSSRLKDQDHGPGLSESSELTTHWANIEDHLRKHDESFIKKYSSDMDTLLVFAGLYSAILTAFIIEFYKLLQQDNSQTTVMYLSRISAQLENRTDDSPPAITDPSNAAFSPKATAVCMNALWFTSLLLSLAAALFAMVAKRWLREYITWTSLSAHPCEVVVLRQLRSRAWERWKVPAILGAIPALLELSLVLFLCGMVILLWTLDRDVAIVLTVCTGIFLVILFALLVLPIISNECPYKSPVGWACVLIWQRIVRALPLSINKTWTAYRHAQLSANTWIRRDLYRTLGIPRHSKHVDDDERAGHAADVFISMAQALLWVKEDSENRTVLNSVEHCTSNIHEAADRLITRSATVYRNPSHILFHRLNTAMFVTSKLLALPVSDLHAALQEEYKLLRPDRIGRSGYDDWMQCVYRTKSDALSTLLRRTVAGGAIHDPARITAQHTGFESEKFKIVSRVLLSALRHVYTHMFPEPPKPDVAYQREYGPHGPPPLPTFKPEGDSSASTQTSTLQANDALNLNDHSMPELEPFRPAAKASRFGSLLTVEELCAFIEMFCLMETLILIYHEAKHETHYLDRRISEFIQLTTKIYFSLNADPGFDSQHPGLRTVVFQTLCRLGNPERVVNGLMTVHGRTLGGLKLDEHRDDSSRYALLANRLYYVNSLPEDRHIFDALVQLIEYACEAATSSLAKGWTNCGCYHELPWAYTLLDVVHGPASRSSVFPWKRLLQLLDRLDENAAHNLLSTPVRHALRDLRTECERLLELPLHRGLPERQAADPVEVSIKEILKITPFPQKPFISASPLVAAPPTAGAPYYWHLRDRSHRARRMSTVSSNTPGARSTSFVHAGYTAPAASPYLPFSSAPGASRIEGGTVEAQGFAQHHHTNDYPKYEPTRLLAASEYLPRNSQTQFVATSPAVAAPQQWYWHDGPHRARRLSTMSHGTSGSNVSPFAPAGLFNVPPGYPYTPHRAAPPNVAHAGTGPPFLSNYYAPNSYVVATPSSIQTSGPSRQGTLEQLEQRSAWPVIAPVQSNLREPTLTSPVSAEPSRRSFRAPRFNTTGTRLSPVIDYGSDVSYEPMVTVDPPSASELPSPDSTMDNGWPPSAPQQYSPMPFTSSPEVHPGAEVQPHAPLLRPRSIPPLPIVPPYSQRPPSSPSALVVVRDYGEWNGPALAPTSAPPPPRPTIDRVSSISERSSTNTETSTFRDWPVPLPLDPPRSDLSSSPPTPNATMAGTDDHTERGPESIEQVPSVSHELTGSTSQPQGGPSAGHMARFSEIVQVDWSRSLGADGPHAARLDTASRWRGVTGGAEVEVIASGRSRTRRRSTI